LPDRFRRTCARPLGIIRGDADMRTFFFRLMHETMAVGRAAGAVFPPDFPTGAIGARFSANDEGPRWRTDLHAGNRLELDWLASKVVALGHKYGSQHQARKRSTRS
jgi:ketopantoate reductase